MTKSLLDGTKKKVYFDPEKTSDQMFRTDPAKADSPAAVGESQADKPGVSANNGAAPAIPATSARRENDNLLGRREVKKVYVSPDDLQPEVPDDSLLLENEAEADEILKDGFAFPWISRTLRVVILLIAAVAGFFIITQTASFLVSVRKLSITEQILLGIPMLIFGGIILWYLLKMLSLLWRLRVSPQIRIKALHELAKRKHLRELSIKANKKAVEELSKLLEDEKAYASRNYADTLRKLSVPEKQIKELEKSRQSLIEKARSRSGTSRDWLSDFRQFFQKPLDDIAKDHIRKHYTHAGVMTGISPYPLLDRLIVLQDSLGMLKELLEIYALKPSWDKDLVLLAKVIISTYLAGIIDNAAESAMDIVMDSIPELTKTTLSKGMDTVFRKAGGKAAGMITQGFFVRRLGIAAMKMLRPVQED